MNKAVYDKAQKFIEYNIEKHKSREIYNKIGILGSNALTVAVKMQFQSDIAQIFIKDPKGVQSSMDNIFGIITQSTW